MRQLWVDFNGVDARGLTTTLATLAEQGAVLAVGQHLVVGDDDGNLCDATIVDMTEDGTVVVSLDLGTFRYSGRHARIAV